MHEQEQGLTEPEKPNKPFTESEHNTYPVVMLRWLQGCQHHTCDQCNQYLYGERSVLSECVVCGRWLCKQCMDDEALCPDCLRLSEEDRGLVNALRQHLRRFL